MACVPEAASLVAPDVIATRPVVSLIFSTSVRGLLAAQASMTEAPVTAMAEPAVTLSLAGTAIGVVPASLFDGCAGPVNLVLRLGGTTSYAAQGDLLQVA
jgi:hypothetical protein